MSEKLPKDQKFKKRKIESTVKSNLHLVDLEVLNEKVKKFTLFDPLVIIFGHMFLFYSVIQFRSNEPD